MNILIIMTTRFGKTGITNAILAFYKGLNKDNLKIDFVLPNEPPVEFTNQVLSNGGKIFILSTRLSNVIKYSRHLSNIMKLTDYDIVHAHGNSHTLYIEMGIAKKNKIKNRIPHSHSTSTNFPVLHRMLYIPFIKSYTTGISCTYDAGKWLFSNNEFRILYNGIDVDKFLYTEKKRQEVRNKLGIPKSEKLIIQVGSFTKNKNQSFSVKLLNELLKKDSNFSIVFVGDGSERNAVELEVDQLSLQKKVKFLGNRADIVELMTASDVIIMPSHYEGMPITLLEAQANGLPGLISQNITKEVNITGNLFFFDLEEEITKTVDLLIKIAYSSRHRELNEDNKLLKNSKVDMYVTSKELEKIYWSLK